MHEYVHLVSAWPVAVGAGTGDSRWVTNPYPFSIKLEQAYVTPQANVSAHATNNTILTVETGDDATVLATYVTTTALTAGTPAAMTMANAGAAAEIGPGEAFLVKKAEGGSGAAFEGNIELRCIRIRG